MGAADKRVAELLDRWLASVERHAGYLDLDDDAYAKAQNWPRHQRPTRWIVELARVRLGELRRQLSERQARGDEGFAESLELMSFLTTLLGYEHVDRFIPQATAAAPEHAPAAPSAMRARSAGGAVGEPTVSRPHSTADGSGVQLRPAKTPATRARAVKADKQPKPDKIAATVIADAARLLSWGREWPQLASLIARLADRPPEQEVWAILRTHRAAIESRMRRVPD